MVGATFNQLELDQRGGVVAHQQLHEGEVGFADLGVGHDLLDRDGEAELDDHLEAGGERAVAVEGEDAEVDVVARESAREQNLLKSARV